MEGVNQKKILLYISFVFILLLLAVFMYLIRPNNTEIMNIEQSLKLKQDEYTALQNKLLMQDDISDMSLVQVEASRRQVPEQPYLESLVRNLRQLEVMSQLQLKQYSFVVGSTETAVIPINIETSFVGTYEQIFTLFTELESLDRLIHVDKLTFNVKQEPAIQLNAPEAPVIANATLTAYYSPSLQALKPRPNKIEYNEASERKNLFH